MIIRQIEPDLLSDVIPFLDHKYRGETPSQREERFASYDRAYLIFQEVLGKLSQEYATEAARWKQQMHAKSTAREKQEKAADLQNIESYFSDAA